MPTKCGKILSSLFYTYDNNFREKLAQGLWYYFASVIFADNLKHHFEKRTKFLRGIRCHVYANFCHFGIFWCQHISQHTYLPILSFIKCSVATVVMVKFLTFRTNFKLQKSRQPWHWNYFCILTPQNSRIWKFGNSVS